MASPSQFPTGSVWRKWDLHIHSPLSILNNGFPQNGDGTPDWEAYLSRLESLDLAVVGITDYFTVEGYKKVKGYQEAGRLKNVYTILPNIEFRLSHVLSSRRDGDSPRRLNFHVIFSDDVSVQDIEEHFLHNLEFYYEAAPQTADQTRKLKISNIEALGEKLIKENASFRNSGQSARTIGAMTTVVNHEQITNILTGDSRFKDKYLLVFPEELSNLIEWGSQDHIIRQVLLQKSDFVFSSNARTRDWCLGKSPYLEGEAAFISEFKSLKACVHGSDAHYLQEIGRPCTKRSIAEHDCVTDSAQCEMRYCWIKSDPTFEGLKQLKYEPADRVRIQSSDPSPLKSNYCIVEFQSGASRVSPELLFSQVDLMLNTGLVAITGSKGAGKTALVDLLANFYVDRRKTKDPNSFVRRVVGDNANFQTSIRLKDGQLITKMLNEDTFIQSSEIVYIAQGELEQYIGEKSDLERYVRDLIFQNPQVKDSVKAFEFGELGKKVGELESTLQQIHRDIENLENRVSQKVVATAQRQKAQIEAELKDVDSRIPTLEAKLTPEKIELVQSKQVVRTGLQVRKESLARLIDMVRNARQFISKDLARFNSFIQGINKSLSEISLQGVLPNLEYSEVTRLDNIQEVGEAELRAVVEKIADSEKELRGYESEMVEHATQLNRRTELATSLQVANQNLDEISANALTLANARAGRDNLMETFLKTIVQQQKKYQEIIALFASQKADVLTDLDFAANITFDFVTLLQGLQDVLDNRQIEVLGDERRPSEFTSILEAYMRLADGNADETSGLVAQIAGKCESVKEKLKKSQAITVGDLYRCFYGNYLSVVPVVTYKRTALNRLSLGQKATVLIKIYLAQGTNTIIIDSHDDHLDNEFIMDELVGAIRHAKSYRQVILASNNGNVVINSDAEQIVLASHENGTISYSSGSIENPEIRDRALKVLEGGATAFRKRQEKYRIS
jgi:energy-coupling factor transporter ATP-binding protein EcfA2